MLVKVQPNPGTVKFTVIMDVGGNKTMERINALGKHIQNSETFTGSANIDISTFPAGVYYLRIVSAKGLALVKLLKE